MPRDRTFRRTGGEEGFTLIELLLVMLIIAIIAAVLIPSFLNQRTKGFDAAAKSIVRTAAIAEETYAIDHNGTYVSETLSATDTGPLQEIEPKLKNAPYVTAVDNGTTGYTLVATSLGNGPDVYTFIDSNGTVTRTCSGSGGGCTNSTW